MLELAGSSSRSGLRFHVAGRRRMATWQGERWEQLERASGRNRAWPLPGGAAAWRAIAARVAPGWPPG